jgi:hypothetical protein
VRFELSGSEVELFAAGPVVLTSDHPAYAARVELSQETRNELLSDLED